MEKKTRKQAERNYNEFRVRISLTPYTYNLVNKLNERRGTTQRFANANLISEIIGKVASGELVQKDGSNFFDVLRE